MSELHPDHLPRAITVLSHLTIFPRVARSPTWRVTLSVATVLLLWRQLGVSGALASRRALQACGERSHRQVAGALEQRLDDLLLGQEARAASMQQGARHRRQLPVQKSLSKELSKEVYDALELLARQLRLGTPDKTADRRKEFELLRHLAANAFPWKAEDVVREMEAFASRKTFLKLAGGAKRRILERAIHEAPVGLVVELGSYVGYSSSVLALARNGPQLPPSPDQRVGREPPAAPVVVSCELDPCNALLARSVHLLAGLAESIEVWIGNSSDMAHYVHRRFGRRSVAMLFMDHRGSLFHEDLQSFQEIGLLKDGAIVVADNVLKPGVPRSMDVLPEVHPTSYGKSVTVLALKRVCWQCQSLAWDIRCYKTGWPWAATKRPQSQEGHLSLRKFTPWAMTATSCGGEVSQGS